MTRPRTDAPPRAPEGGAATGPSGNGARGASEAPAVHIEFVELEYGCHSGRFEVAVADVPFVIAGPNGAGKTTLIEAAIRTLFGFRRRRADERTTEEARRPWSHDEFRARVGMRTPKGRLTFERAFDGDQVVVRREGETKALFEGEANPAGSTGSSRQYRELLQRVWGLAELDDYERTACVDQGGLLGTTLSEDLLQLAAGGHADVETAKEALRKEYQVLSVEPIVEGESRRRKAGRAERRREELGRVEARLAEAREIESRRAPLAAERDGVRSDLAAAEDEIVQLEDAFQNLSEIERLEATRRRSEERLEQLEVMSHALDESLARLGLLEGRPVVAEGALYPADFPERVAALEEGLWPRRRELAERRDRLHRQLLDSPATARWRGVAAALAGTAAVAAGAILLGGAFAAAGWAFILTGFLGLGLAAWETRRRAVRQRAARRLAEIGAEEAAIAARIERRLEGVPHAGSLTPDTLPDRRREYERQRAEARMRDEAETALRRAMDRARDTLARLADPAGEGIGPVDAPIAAERNATSGSLGDRATDLLTRLQEATSRERNERLAPALLRLRDASRQQLSLPPDVRPEVADVRQRLQGRRAERKRLSEQLAQLERRLAYEGRPAESSVALAARREELAEDVLEIEEHAASHRHAFRLIADAYEEFRRTDQERLLEAVSEHLAGVTDRALGPLTATGGLDTARLRAGDRQLPLSSPPLSYGQLHSVLFAIRLGAADFLAGLGVRVPLIIDDPFVHLDERRAGELWGVLCRIARQRQVILATQDRLLLDHLGIRPDLELARQSGASRPPSADAEPPASRPETAGSREEEPAESSPDTADAPPQRASEPPALDLWSSLTEPPGSLDASD